MAVKKHMKHLWYSQEQENRSGTAIGVLEDGRRVHYTEMFDSKTTVPHCPDAIYLGLGYFESDGRAAVNKFNWEKINIRTKFLIERREAYTSMLRFIEQQVLEDGTELIRLQTQCPHGSMSLGCCICCGKDL